jgi:hypothetical protein
MASTFNKLRPHERLLEVAFLANIKPYGFYRSALIAAAEGDTSPFSTVLYANIYASAASSSRWMLYSLLLSIESDAGAAERAWFIAGGTRRAEERALFAQRARCLAADARRSISITDLAFPGSLEAEFRSDLLAMVPDRSWEPPDTTYNFNLTTLVGSNVEALRRATLLLLQRPPLLRIAPAANQPELNRLIEEKINFTLDHVTRTAARIDPMARALGERHAPVFFSRCLRALARETAEEPIDIVYNLRFGNYP